MKIPTICTLLPPSGADATFEAAIACARRFESHLDAVCVASPPMDTSAFMPGMGTGLIADTIEETRARLREAESRVKMRLAREDISWDSHADMTGADGVSRILRDTCRFADLAVLSRPHRDNVESESLFDFILFGTSLPILICAGPDAPALERVTIAWDSSDQALAATRAALPLLKKARMVTILMVAPPPSPKGRFAPGECLARFLSRHDIDCDIDLLPKVRNRVADVIRQHASDSQTDLLVMGAYGHSKLRESLLGGVTRDMTADCDVPLFLAR